MHKKVIVLLFLMFSFNAGLVFAQEVVSVNPVQNALDISKSTNISVTFDQDMNASTINDSTFIVHSLQTGWHTGIYSYDIGTNTATFDPDSNFAAGEIVSVILTTDIENATGDSLTRPYEWSFTVEVDGGSGEFAEKKVNYGTGDWSWSIFSSDLNSDGDMDLVVGHEFDSIAVLLNNGDGTFATNVDYGTGDDPHSVFSSDLDGDSDMDLAVANSDSTNVSILLNNGDGTFAEKVNYSAGSGPSSIFSSDLDGDGDMDLATANGDSNNVSILLNNGDGTFAEKVDYTTGSGPHSIFSSDLDGDGDMDLAVANLFSHSVSVLMNNGDGTFAAKVDYGTGSYSYAHSVFSSDLDGNGNIDLAVANWGRENVSVLLNNGDGTFAEKVDYATGSGSHSIFSSDLDGDGDMDLATANYLSNNVSVLLNNGDGTFAEKVDYAKETFPESIFSSDLDGDGDMDLAVANKHSNNLIFLLNSEPLITVTSPNGGEEWVVDNTYNITWNSAGTSGAVKLEYSTDNGSSWTEIIASMPDTGSYPWVIPDNPSNSCLVMVSDTNAILSDTSDGVFTISSLIPFITVTSPNGGEEWVVDSTYNITWTSAGTSGNVHIEFYSADSGFDYWADVIASTPDDGSHPWTIPNVPSDSCLVRITVTDGSPSDMCDAKFAIVLTSGISDEVPDEYSFDLRGIALDNRLEVRYALPIKAFVKFSLYDILGAKIKKIVEEKPAGFHSIEIDMNNRPKGVYFLKIEANGFTKTSKAVLM